jgi:hypothetical protein
MAFTVALYGTNEQELSLELANFQRHMDETILQIKNLGIDLPPFVIVEKYLHIKKTQMIVIYDGGTREMAFRYLKTMVMQPDFNKKDYIKVD